MGVKSMPSENLLGVLENYDVKVKDIKNENYKVKKGVWWIQTNEGYKILKKNSIPKEKLDFIIAAIEYLCSRGVHMPEIIKSIDGKKYIELDGANYILNEAIKGENASSKTNEGLKKIIKTLAQFHKASVGFKSPKGCKPNILLGSWYHKSQKKMNQLKEFYEQEKKQNKHNEFGQIIIDVFPDFLEKMKSALADDNKLLYDKWVNDIKDVGCLVHQDFIDGNLILTSSNEIYVLDPDSIAIDLPTRDIRKILNKVMKKRGGWDLNETKNIINWYQEINPLELWQWKVLKSTIMYPHLFAGIMSKYYQRRETTWSESKYVDKLKKTIKIEKSKDDIINNFDKLF
jgi:CotS family spore coat protein